MNIFSGTYRSTFDVKSISSMTSENISDVYKYSGLQALLVTVFKTSVDLLCKKSYKSSFLLGYIDCFLKDFDLLGQNKTRSLLWEFSLADF